MKTEHKALVAVLRKVVDRKQFRWKVHDSVILGGRRIYWVGCSCNNCVARAREVTEELKRGRVPISEPSLEGAPSS